MGFGVGIACFNVAGSLFFIPRVSLVTVHSFFGMLNGVKFHTGFLLPGEKESI